MELWKEELKKDINKKEEDNKLLKLDSGLHSFVIDLSTKKKEVIDYNDKKYTYHLFNLVKNEYESIKLTNFQYFKLLEQIKEVFKDKEICRYIEVNVEVKNLEEYKKDFYFKIKELGDNLI